MLSWIKTYEWRRLSFLLLGSIMSLSGIGVLMIGSTQPSLQNRQLAGAVIGALAMLLFALLDYRTLMDWKWIVYAGCLFLLLLTRLLGDEAGGATRWVELGAFRFQPSEPVKIGLILFFASFFEEEKERENQWITFFLSIALAGILLALILTQPDLSTTIVAAAVFLAMLYLSGIRLRILAAGAAAAIPAAAGGIILADRLGMGLFGSYQFRRILAWLNPQDYVQDAYQQQNAIMAIGSGRLLGKGLNNEGVFSVKNGNYIPEPQTDFIMAVVGEELGFVGSSVVILLLLALGLECMRIGKHAGTLSGRLFCAGFGFLIGFQAFVNICVVSGLMPNTGLTLPFVSYGLSSLISLFVGAGIVLNISMGQRRLFPLREPYAVRRKKESGHMQRLDYMR